MNVPEELIALYHAQGWKALSQHAWFTSHTKALLLEAVSRNEVELAVRVLPLAEPLNDILPAVFTVCCTNTLFDLARQVIAPVAPMDVFVRRYCARTAYQANNVALANQIIMSADPYIHGVILFNILQACERNSDLESFSLWLPLLSTENVSQTIQEDLCELLLWRAPDFAEKMLHSIPGLLNRMEHADLAEQGRENLNRIAAQAQNKVLSTKLPNKEPGSPKKM